MDISDGEGQAMRKVILFLSVFASVAFAETDASCVKDVQNGVIYLDSMRCVVDQNGNGMADDCGELPVCRRHGERFFCPMDEGDRLCMREDVVVRDRTDSYVRFETKNPVSFEEWQAFLREHNLSCAESGDRGREWLCGDSDSGLSDGGLRYVVLRGKETLPWINFEVVGEVWLTAFGYIAYCTDDALDLEGGYDRACDQYGVRALGRLIFRGESGRLYRINLHRDRLGCAIERLNIVELQPLEVRGNSVRANFPERVNAVRDVESITQECVRDNNYDLVLVNGMVSFPERAQVRGYGRLSEARFSGVVSRDSYLAFDGMVFYCSGVNHEQRANPACNRPAWRAFEEGVLLLVGEDGRYYAVNRPDRFACGSVPVEIVSYNRVEVNGIYFYRLNAPVNFRGIVDWESVTGECINDNSFNYMVYIQPRKIGVGIDNNPLRCRDCIDRIDTTKGVVKEEPVYEESPTYSDNTACVNVRFFSGWRMSCRVGGLFMLGQNCCGSGGLLQMLCRKSEKELRKRRTALTCVEIGKYCSKRVKVGPAKICVEESKSFCCFNSRLSRILQECGRPQIGKTWGSAKSPDCSGFSMEEFQRLDFSNPECVRAIEEWVMEKAGSFGSVDSSGIAQKGVQAVERWLDDARNRKRD